MTMTDAHAVRELFDQHVEFHNYDETAEHYAYTLPENALTFDTWGAMQRAVIDSGSHFFDAAAVRFFRGRSDKQLFGRRFWVESKKFVWHGADGTTETHARVYQVSWVSEYNGSLSVERWGEFRTLETARRYCQRFAEAVTTADATATDRES